MLVERVERHVLKESLNEIDLLCFYSKNLYNYCNYILRQSFIEAGKIPNLFELSHRLAEEKQIDWDRMKANTNQQVLKQLYKDWKSFFNSIKEFKKNPVKFFGKPKLPKYKDKQSGRNYVNFTCNNKSNIYDGHFHFPKFTKILPIKTRVTNETLCCARIVPDTSCYWLEIVYEVEVPDSYIFEDGYLSIDLGINNFASCYDEQNHNSFILNGKQIKSFNLFYSKKMAEIQSVLQVVNNKNTSKKLKKLALKRDNKINDFMHKASKLIIDYCVLNGIKTVVIGHNKNWKQNSSVGKINNQKFVQIPYNKFIEMLRYKCENTGLEFILTEESYTSKIDHYALEEMQHQESYLGKRKRRGLFQSSKGFEINADINGALGILRKVINDSLFREIIDRGPVIGPNRINVFQTSFY